MKKVNGIIYKCIDCGKEKLIKQPKYSKPREDYRCFDCSMKHRSLNKGWLTNNKIAMQKSGKRKRKQRTTYKCGDCGKERIALPSQMSENKTGEYRCIKCANKKRSEENPYWLKNIKSAAVKRSEDLTIRKRMSVSAKRRCDNAKYKEDFKNRINKPEVKQKANEKIKLRYLNPDFIEKQTGEGFWYGHHRLSGKERKYYCELWNQDLWNRIDAAYDFKSIISGKTRFENYKEHNLDRHHVYWQEKACCKWDEDVGGYYAWINNGTTRHPQFVKYYINGDPNEFVLLTLDEHGKMQGNKKEGTDKIYYIKYLENLIEKRAADGKKCYLSPEEYEIYKVKHADLIKKYKK